MFDTYSPQTIAHLESVQRADGTMGQMESTARSDQWFSGRPASESYEGGSSCGRLHEYSLAYPESGQRADGTKDRRESTRRLGQRFPEISVSDLLSVFHESGVCALDSSRTWPLENVFVKRS